MAEEAPRARPAEDSWDRRAYLAWRRCRDLALFAPTALACGLRLAPGVVSLLGVASAASVVWTLERQPGWALAGLLGALFFDALDGAVARRSGAATRSGKLFDQLCDSASFVALLTAGVVAGAAPPATALLAAYCATMATVLALAASAAADGLRWAADPKAGLAGHAPKIFYFVALGLHTLGQPGWIPLSLRLTLVTSLLAVSLSLFRLAGSLEDRLNTGGSADDGPPP